MKSPIHF